MREYETVFITQPNISETQLKQVNERLGALVEKNQGRLFYARNMGKRTLAYPIEKQTKGIYTCLDYAAQGGAVGEIEHSLKLDENVLRFLTVVKAEEVDIEARAQEIEAKGEALPVTEETLQQQAKPAAASATDDDTSADGPAGEE